jgi:hypothetical protein
MAMPEIQEVRIPADPADQLTTNAKSAVPPTEFRVLRSGAFNMLYIVDRQGVQNRQPTASYRAYFLPAAFAPDSTGNSSTLPNPVIARTVARAAGQKVASLVTEIAAPGLGTVLTYQDYTNVGQKGYYYCVAVNRSGVEAPPEQIVKAPE